MKKTISLLIFALCCVLYSKAQNLTIDVSLTTNVKVIPFAHDGTYTGCGDITTVNYLTYGPGTYSIGNLTAYDAPSCGVVSSFPGWTATGPGICANMSSWGWDYFRVELSGLVFFVAPGTSCASGIYSNSDTQGTITVEVLTTPGGALTLWIH